MPDLTIPVPDARVAEFYQFFGLWLAGDLSPQLGASEGSQTSAEAPATPLRWWGTDEEDYEDAKTLWAKYSPSARKMFSLLIDNAPKRFTGEEVAAEVGIDKGAHGVAGVLAWPGRHGAAIGRGLPTEWGEDPETQEGYYYVPVDRAEVFKAARKEVEGGS